MKNKDTYSKGIAKDQEKHTGEQGEFFTVDGSENLGVTDMFVDDGFDIIHQHGGNVHLSNLSPEEEETSIPKGSKKVKKTVLKPRLDKEPFNEQWMPDAEGVSFRDVSKINDDKLNIPKEKFLEYLNNYHREKLIKELTPILECVIYNCYGGWENDPENENPDNTEWIADEYCEECSEDLNNVLGQIDNQIVKLGLVKPRLDTTHGVPTEKRKNDYPSTTILERPFPYTYNEWIEGVVKEIDPKLFVNQDEEIDSITQHEVPQRISEHIDTGINPELEVGDIVRVIDVDGEHGRMPKRFGVYKVVKVGNAYPLMAKRNRGHDTFYDIIPYPEVESRVTRHYKHLPAHHEESDFTLYRGDAWIYGDGDRRKINEQGFSWDGTYANEIDEGNGADTSWSNDEEKITLQDILELTKDIPIINYPTKELAKLPSLKKLVSVWNPEEIERISQVDVSRQYPILIMVNEYNEVQWILDGNHRAQQAVMNDIPTIPAKLIKPSDLDERSIKIFYPDGIPSTNQTISEHNESLRQTKNLNPDLMIGDEIMVVSTEGIHDFGTPELFKPYLVIGIKYNHNASDPNRKNNRPDYDKPFYQIEPLGMTDDERTGAMLAGGGRARPMYIFSPWLESYRDDGHTGSDQWILRPGFLRGELNEDDGAINDMVYIDEPREKHIKRMGKDLGVFDNFPINTFMNIPPPENESDTTEDEIEHIEEIPVDDKFVETTDDMHKHFELFLKSKNLEYPKDVLEEILSGIRAIILKLKYHYNRPRPQQVASAKDLVLNPTTLDTTSTPAYPSGHATQGRFVARYLTDVYPDYHDELIRVGNEVGDGRLMAKVHYPSDQAFGKVLGDELYNYYYTTKGLKLKEITLKEEMEELSPPLILGDKIMVWDLEPEDIYDENMPSTLIGTIIDVYEDKDIDKDNDLSPPHRGGIKYIVRDDNSGEEYGLYQGIFGRKYSQSKMVRELSGRDKWKIIGRYEEIVNEQEELTPEPEKVEYGTFSQKDIIILNYISKKYTKEDLMTTWEETHQWGEYAKKWDDIMKLFSIPTDQPENLTVSTKYARWAWENWDDAKEYDMDFGKIPNPIKTTLKWYDVEMDETGSQVEYKSGNAEILGFDEDDVENRAGDDFYGWGGELETHDYGDYESYDQEVTRTEFLRMEESVRDNQKLLFNFWKKVGPTLDPDKLKLVGFNMDVYEDSSVVWDNLKEYYGDEELTNIIQERLEGLHDIWNYEYIVTDFNFDGDEIYLNVLVNGDAQIPMAQEEGGVIDISLWDIFKKTKHAEDGYFLDISNYYADIYDEVRDSVSDDIKEFLLKDLPVDADLEYLDISEPGSFEDYVKFNKVEMVTIKEDDDGYIDEDLENWSYDGEDIGVLDEEMVTDKVDMIKHDIFKMMSSRFEVIKDSKGEISDNEGNRYSIIDTEEEVEDVTLSDLLVPITDFLSLGMEDGTFTSKDVDNAISGVTDWLSLELNKKQPLLN